jgi:hypothetical protein
LKQEEYRSIILSQVFSVFIEIDDLLIAFLTALKIYNFKLKKLLQTKTIRNYSFPACEHDCCCHAVRDEETKGTHHTPSLRS